MQRAAKSDLSVGETSCRRQFPKFFSDPENINNESSVMTGRTQYSQQEAPKCRLDLAWPIPGWSNWQNVNYSNFKKTRWVFNSLKEKHENPLDLPIQSFSTLFEIFIFCPKFNFDFPTKLSIFLGWKTRENVVVLDFLAVDNFDFTRKIVKRNLGEKLVKMLGFGQNRIFGQKFDFWNSVGFRKPIRIHNSFWRITSKSRWIIQKRKLKTWI